MRKSLSAIENKVYSGKRITAGDALTLFGSDDILAIGKMADFRRRETAGDEVYYSYNLNVNPTNVCELRCGLCAFSRDRGEAGSYESGIPEILERVRKIARKAGGKLFEAHIVGGLNPAYGLEFYEKLLPMIKKSVRGVTVQAFTAVEVDYFARLAGIGLHETLLRLKKAGLDAMPGGGAEIFAPGVREKICPDKMGAGRWLEVMRHAHEVGIPSNATMLYGHVESDEDRVDHMDRLRGLQDETGGFRSFVPLAFHEKNTRVERSRPATGFDDLKVVAVARLFLDNFRNVKALYTSLGLRFAQIALEFGANDLGGTSLDERIADAAGAGSHSGISEADLVKTIEGAERVPVRTNSLYAAGRAREAKNA